MNTSFQMCTRYLCPMYDVMSFTLRVCRYTAEMLPIYLILIRLHTALMTAWTGYWSLASTCKYVPMVS